MTARDWTHIPWAQKTWGERAQKFASGVIASTICLAMLIGFLFLVGMMDDANVANHIEHDRCLKHATNGYEITQCR